MTWRWPWTSVARLDDAREEIVYLRARVADLTDQLVRIHRVENGLTETPRPPRPVPEPIPKEFLELCMRYASPTIQREMRNAGIKASARGKSWAAIIAEVRKELDGGNPEAPTA